YPPAAWRDSMPCSFMRSAPSAKRERRTSHRVKSGVFWGSLSPVDAQATPVPAFPLRAMGVLLIWVVGVLPSIYGLRRCPIAMWAHHPCPGCGMSRAMQLLARGEVASSLALQPLAVPVALSAALLACATVAVTLLRGSPMPLWEHRFARVAVAIF